MAAIPIPEHNQDTWVPASGASFLPLPINMDSRTVIWVDMTADDGSTDFIKTVLFLRGESGRAETINFTI